MKRVDHGIAPRGAMYAVAVDPRNSAQIFCSTNKGQFYESLDDGASWKECSLPENVKRLSALAVGKPGALLIAIHLYTSARD